MKTCELCKHFDMHPFIREGDYTSYCMITDKEIEYDDKACNAFEIEEYIYIEELFQ